MHREREGTAEAAVRSYRVKTSAEVMHRAADPLNPSLPFPPFTPQGRDQMKGTARNHPVLSLSKRSRTVG